MTQSVQLEAPVSVIRTLASARVAQVSREPCVMSVMMAIGTWMETMGVSPATVTENMLLTTSVTRSQASVYASQNMEAEYVTSVVRITLETLIYSACFVTVTWRAPFIQLVTLTRVSVCVSQE